MVNLHLLHGGLRDRDLAIIWQAFSLSYLAEFRRADYVASMRYIYKIHLLASRRMRGPEGARLAQMQCGRYLPLLPKICVPRSTFERLQSNGQTDSLCQHCIRLK